MDQEVVHLFLASEPPLEVKIINLRGGVRPRVLFLHDFLNKMLVVVIADLLIIDYRIGQWLPSISPRGITRS